MNKFQNWIIYGLLLSIIPIILAILITLLKAEAEESFWGAFQLSVERGELFLICVSLLGVNIGELSRRSTQNKSLRGWFIGLSFLVILIVSGLFSVVNTGVAINKLFSFNSSLTFFVLTIVICTTSNLTLKTSND